MTDDTSPIYVAQHTFVPGVYEHYKGGHYAALMLVAHHETREPMVVYTSLLKGNVQVREWKQPPTPLPAVDSWNDLVAWPDGTKQPRFKWLRSFA